MTLPLCTILAACAAFAPPIQLATRSTATSRTAAVHLNSAEERRAARAAAGDMKWNPGEKPATMVNSGRGKFTYDSESGIGGGLTAITSKRRTREMVEKMKRKQMVQVSGSSGKKVVVQQQAAGKRVSAESRTERIARGRALLQSAIEERFSVLLAPHLEAFSKDEIDEAELAWRKAEARKEAEGELSDEKQKLDECEALLYMVVEADAHVSSLSNQLEAATLARDEATVKLEAALGEVA